MKTILKFTFFFILAIACNNAFAQTKPKESKKSKTTTAVKSKTQAAPAAIAPAVQQPAQAKPAVQMTFKEETIKLGTMKKGSKKTFDYEFENTGTETIEIEIVSGCDCTTLDWTRGPIKPGGKGKINVIFDSTEKELSEKSVDVDIYLKNKDKKTGSQILKIVNYTFDLVK